MSAPEIYNLNLHESYQPDWGVWEVAREIYSNAIDSDPKGMKIIPKGTNQLIIETTTCPDVSYLLIIGHGTKDERSKDIGQFGEGTKLAALAATRSGGSLVVETKRETIEFFFREYLGERVLHASRTPSRNDCQFRCTITMPLAAKAIEGKILQSTFPHTIEKQEHEPPRIFSKGIWICDLPVANAVWSFNLNDLKINRDRNLASQWSIMSSIAALLLDKVEQEDPRVIKTLLTKSCWETEECLLHTSPHQLGDQKRILAKEFYNIHGNNAVIYTDITYAQMARSYDLKPVMVGKAVVSLLEGHVKSDYEALPVDTEYTESEVPADKYEKQILYLNRIAEHMSIVPPQIRVFSSNRIKISGHYRKGSNNIWINEREFMKDNKRVLVATYLHELAHYYSQADDYSLEFQHTLEYFASWFAVSLFLKS